MSSPFAASVWINATSLFTGEAEVLTTVTALTPVCAPAFHAVVEIGPGIGNLPASGPVSKNSSWRRTTANASSDAIKTAAMLTTEQSRIRADIVSAFQLPIAAV